MDVAPRSSPLLSYQVVVVTILLLGAVVSATWYWEGRRDEEEHAALELTRRASLRHALTSEVLQRYEDSLFALSAVFMVDESVTRDEFARATSRLADRITGAQAVEWVPLVTHDDRAAMEAAIRLAYAQQPFEFIEYDADGRPHRAPNRPFYYPISFVEPLRGNERALGFNVATGPTARFLDRARETARMMVTNQFRLVQDIGEQQGLVMIWPVFHPLRMEASAAPVPAPPDRFMGFLQSVFRVQDLLETAHSRQPDAMLDALFVDTSETEPSKRILFYRPADEAGPRMPWPTEEEFRRSAALVVEHAIPIGGREWRAFYRPTEGWIEQQRSSAPLVRLGGVLVLSWLVAGLVILLGRRTQVVRQQVQKRTAELAESQRQLANLLRALPGMAYRCRYDDQLTILFLSEGVRELTGWTAAEFMAGRAHFRDLIHPEDLDRVRAATRSALQHREEVEVEYRLRTRSGEEKWVLSRGRGVYAADGTLDTFEGLAIDVTARKNAESGRLLYERKLLDGQKLESLGLLAGGIAHDFNNLLSTILGNASLARVSQSAAPGPEMQLRAIETAAKRAAELCRQMLAYAGQGRFVIEPTNLTALVEGLVPLLHVSVAQQASLQLQLDPHLPPVRADATQLRQIVMNLVLNAADAIAVKNQFDGGNIFLTTGVMSADPARLAGGVAGADLPAADYVFLEVRDTGAGMPPDVLKKIFDPFFTTKFSGRGLGLAAVLGIVRGHQGALSVESTPGAGTRFRLLLPPVAADLPTSASAVPWVAGPRERWTRAGRVLVIDDEEPVRMMVVAMLNYFGLTPIDAADGEAGLALFRAEPQAFDLVMLDLLMPGMNGEQTLAALRAIKPEVRVLLVSGYSQGDILGRLAGPGPLGFLSKPFGRESMEKKLQEVFAS